MKKSIFSKITVITLLGFVLPTIGCGQTEDPQDEVTSAENTTAGENNYDIYSDLPTGHYGNETFTILNNSFTYAEYRLDAEELNGDAFNDVVYNRTRKVEEELKVKIEVKNMDYWSENSAAYINNIVMSGDDSIDACFLGVANNVANISKNLYIDLKSVDEINFEKPWWDSNSMKVYDINGKIYTALCEASANLHDQLWSCFFNKKIADDNKQDIYKLVKDGKWTIDKMLELIEVAANDINGDNVMGADDQWGLMTHYGAAFGILHGADARGIDIENGIPFVSKIDDHMFDVITKIRTIFNSTGTMTNNKHQNTFGYTCVKGFSDGKSLFLIEVLGNAAALRSMNTDFGIIPFPKYDETQNEYIAYYSPATNGFCIPKTVKDISRTGTVIEVMSAYGYKEIRPAYYDVVLSGKTARDNESVEMLDIIFSNIETEMAYTYVWGGYNNTLTNVMTGTSEIVSTLEANRVPTETAIKKYIDDTK